MSFYETLITLTIAALAMATLLPRLRFMPDVADLDPHERRGKKNG